MSEAKIAVVDYCKGNLKSVERGLRFVGGRGAQITADPEEIAAADAIVLPGVGAYADASRFMQDSGQMDVVRDKIHAGTPFLGICLGEHLLFTEGVEGAPEGRPAVGLGIVPGVVERMPRHDAAGKSYKVPHVGWNTVDQAEGCDTPLLAGISDHEYFYFTHSYIAPVNPCTQATTTHSATLPLRSGWHDTAFGVQFHPEKAPMRGMRCSRFLA
jgi:glutamine amidotransferase